MGEEARFSARLRWWRERRGLSQLALANTADVSQRHLSFLELGRTAPSRNMVLRLSAALDLPLRAQNELLNAAGFARVWVEAPLGAQELAIVERALDFMLMKQEPYPAFVVDRRWNVLRANRGAQHLVAFLTGGLAPTDPDPANPANLAEALIAPGVLRPFISNWREVALYFLRGVRADALADGSDETTALLRRLVAYPDVPALSEIPEPTADQPVLPIEFVKDETRLRLFTTLATLGTPRAVIAQEIRVESFFPADDAAAAILRGWSG